MTHFELAKEEVLLYLLTEFPVDHEAVYIRDLARTILYPTYSAEWIDGWWAAAGDQVIDQTVEEYNYRLRLGLYLRFEPADDIGSKIAGRPQADDGAHFTAFQLALLKLTDKEFEVLSARVLSWAGCTSYWSTPASHDEGLDAFGHMPLLHVVAKEGRHPSVVMLMQAKHYWKSKVHTGEVRELVGSTVLAKYETYAAADKKYIELETRPLVPLAIFFLTSGEVTRDARGLAKKAGIYLLTSRDMYTLFQRSWESSGKHPTTQNQMYALIKRELKGIPVAR